MKGKFLVEIRRKDGTIEYDEFHNVVTNEGRVYLMKCGISNEASQITAWYLGLIGANVTPSVNDTASTALGTGGTYSEITNYSQTSRPSFTCAYTSNPTHQVNNYNSVAEFSFTGTATIYGAFVVSSSTKQSSSGVLLAAGRLSSPKSMSSGDVIAIKYAITV